MWGLKTHPQHKIYLAQGMKKPKSVGGAIENRQDKASKNRDGGANYPVVREPLGDPISTMQWRILRTSSS